MLSILAEHVLLLPPVEGECLVGQTVAGAGGAVSGSSEPPGATLTGGRPEQSGYFMGLDTGLNGHKKVNSRKRLMAVHVSMANALDGQQGIELLAQLEACRPQLSLICAVQVYQGDFQEDAD